MSMRNETPDPVDALIDDVARQLVAGQPSSSLRSAVRDRIGRRRLPWVCAPAFAAAGTLAIVAMLVGPTGAPDAERAVPSATVARIERPAHGIEPMERFERREPSERFERLERLERSERLERFERLERLERSADLTFEEEEPLIPPIMIEPLTAIEPLASVQIAVDTSSGVMPIEIAPLQIEPLLSE
jgi:hypothetical protein